MSIIELLKKTLDAELQAEQLIVEAQKQAQKIIEQAETKARTLETEAKRKARENEKQLIEKSKIKGEKVAKKMLHDAQQEIEIINENSKSKLNKAISIIMDKVLNY